MSEQDLLDITPDPKVLLALTQNPMRPLDALCELIDNGIDSFQAARLQGVEIRGRLIEVTVPGQAEVRQGNGIVRIADNGPGMDRDALANTLRAGYSGKNKFDSLGLFGMGFNIATGKLGRRTVVTTARPGDEQALRVTLNLPEIVKSREFKAPIETVEKPLGFTHGTVLEVADWWPAGDPNHGFIGEVAKISQVQLRAQLSRRYATILRRDADDSIRVLVNREALEPHEHCVWSSERFVTRRGWGNIPAMYEFNEVIAAQRRCAADGTIVPEGQLTCLECGSAEVRTVEERVRGWVGIQRFDDSQKFGIDLIRKGRAIRPAEKDAFFNYVNQFGESSKEYPVDQQYGRIVGEVHLDHVPVDFQKQDFQRTSDEWQRAMDYLRGGSLLPSNWADGNQNTSPISMLFQGYRKVRNFGREDMYMGTWDSGTDRAGRISRQVETDYLERFGRREVGYFDDVKWWELVESATTPPIVSTETCPYCAYQNIAGSEVCEGCDAILIGKDCVVCDVWIRASALACPTCGASQVPDVQEPWTCEVCRAINEIDDETCNTCGAVRGAEDPMSPEVLTREGIQRDDLSFQGRTFLLADGTFSAPLDVTTTGTGALRPKWDAGAVPTMASRSPGRIQVFVSEGHPVFARLGVRPVELVATEAAQYLHSLHPNLQGRPGHSVPNLTAVILADVWGDTLSVTADTATESIHRVFGSIVERLEVRASDADFYDSLDEYEQRELADRLISDGRLDELTVLKSTGRFLHYVGPAVLARYFTFAPDRWFGRVWDDQLPDPEEVGAAAAKTAADQQVGIYSRCLDDCAAFLRFKYQDPLIVDRVIASKRFLEAHLK